MPLIPAFRETGRWISELEKKHHGLQIKIQPEVHRKTLISKNKTKNQKENKVWPWSSCPSLLYGLFHRGLLACLPSLKVVVCIYTQVYVMYVTYIQYMQSMLQLYALCNDRINVISSSTTSKHQ